MGYMSYTIEFTDAELNAIYDAIEEASPRDDPSVEEALESVIAKITPDGSSYPAGAVASQLNRKAGPDAG